jgi:N-acetyl-gamma-glutamyl-phosphate reductase
MTRGILATCYARLTEPMTPAELTERYREYYRSEPFVRVVENPPATKHTWGSNFCYICPRLSPQSGRVIVTSCLDNLVKGAAGQAIQNMNLMLGHPEEMGIEALPVYP